MNFKQEPYKFLSNMHLCPVLLDGVIYPSSENAYQAAKTEDRQQFTAINPYEAKRLGRRVPLSKRIVIKPWYGRDGVNKAKANGYVYTMRVPGMRYHLGNPFTPEARLAKDLILVPSVKEAVIAYIAWVLFSYEERAIQLRKWLEQGVMKGKPLVYYKDLGEPSHAHALEWLIDNWEEACILIDFSSLTRR